MASQSCIRCPDQCKTGHRDDSRHCLDDVSPVERPGSGRRCRRWRRCGRRRCGRWCQWCGRRRRGQRRQCHRYWYWSRRRYGSGHAGRRYDRRTRLGRRQHEYHGNHQHRRHRRRRWRGQQRSKQRHGCPDQRSDKPQSGDWAVKLHDASVPSGVPMIHRAWGAPT